MADAIGILMGSNIYSPQMYVNGNNALNSGIDTLITQEFNKAIVIETGWGTMGMEKEAEGLFDFSAADSILNMALSKGMVVEGDDLIFGLSNLKYTYLGQIEATLKAQGLNPEQMKDRLWGIVQNHVKIVVEHFKGNVSIWSAVNEYRGPEFQNPDIYSRLSLGDDDGFLEMVFRTARTADPSAIIFWNDNGLESTDAYNYKINSPRVQRLRKLGLIDAVATQMVDLDVDKPPTALSDTLKSWKMPAFISSAMFGTKNVPGDDAAKAEFQAQVVGELFDTVLDSGVCKDFSMWQAAEGDTPNSFRGVDAHATIFDAKMQPKPAYFTLKDCLMARVDRGWSAA
jgi:endo-1,4-beta-xylanase